MSFLCWGGGVEVDVGVIYCLKSLFQNLFLVFKSKLRRHLSGALLLVIAKIRYRRRGGIGGSGVGVGRQKACLIVSATTSLLF